MAKKAIEVVPHGNQWAVKKQGAERASSLHDNKAPAVKQATQQAKSERTELIIKKSDGTIQNKNSFGNDPCPPRDRKP
jgi:hypothetical protein